MQNKRRHKRFRLDLMEINGRMILAQKVEIVDISLGGIAVKTDKRLMVGKDYLVKLGSKGKNVDVKAVVVRCELSGIEDRGDGEGVSIYSAGMMFKDVPTDAIAGLIHSIERDKKASAVANDRRLSVRFYIATPWEETLMFPSQFEVKVIGLGGMLIRTAHPLEKESLVPMGLSLQDSDKPVNLVGRVASCQKLDVKGQASYEIGVEFRELKDQDKALVKMFIEYLTAKEAKDEAKRQGN